MARVDIEDSVLLCSNGGSRLVSILVLIRGQKKHQYAIDFESIHGAVNVEVNAHCNYVFLLFWERLSELGI